MSTFKSKLKYTASLLPPLRRLFAERDALRLKNEALQKDVQQLQEEMVGLRRQLDSASQQLRQTWVPPGHFYSPLPAFAEVKVNEDEIFEHPPQIRGIDLREAEQVELLKHFSTFYYEQPFTAERQPTRRYYFENPNYSYNDAIVLYCMIRHLKPRRIVEIGSGYSSCAMLDINEIFFDNSILSTFIDPYPQLLRDLLKDSDHQRIQVIPRKVQDVDIEVFRQLEAGDILFVDSSHVTKTGSDVNYIVFKILPLLQEGVHVHFHDIFYPFEYPLDWVYEGRGWNEAYLVRAFLQYNRAFEIEFFNSFLMEKYPDVFQSALPLCLTRPGANIWLKKTHCDPVLDRIQALRPRKPRRAPASLDPSKWEDTPFLRDGWYVAESDHCWMGQAASVQLAGPAVANQRLVIRGFNPHQDGAVLSAMADEVPLGSTKLAKPGEIAAEFELPLNLVGRSTITLHLAVDRIHTAPGDPRKLGLAVNRIELR